MLVIVSSTASRTSSGHPLPNAGEFRSVARNKWDGYVVSYTALALSRGEKERSERCSVHGDSYLVLYLKPELLT